MADQNVEVGVKVIGDAAGSNEVSESLKAVTADAKAAEEALAGISGPGKDLEALAGTAELVTKELTAAEKAAKELQDALSGISGPGSNMNALAASAENSRAAIRALWKEAKEVERAMAGISGPGKDMESFAATAEIAGKSTESFSAKAKHLEETLNRVGGRGAAANDILEASSAVMKGNEKAALSAAKGIAGMIAAFSAGGLTLALSVVGLLFAALTQYVSKSTEAKAASESLGKVIKETFEKLADLNNSPMDKLERSIASVNKEYDEQLRKLKAIQEAEDALSDAQFSADKSAVDRYLREGKITPEQHAQQTSALENQNLQRLVNRPVEKADAEAGIYEREAAAKSRIAADTTARTSVEIDKLGLDIVKKSKELISEFDEANRTAADIARIRASGNYQLGSGMDLEVVQAEWAARARAAEIKSKLGKVGIDPTSKDAPKTAEEETKDRAEKATALEQQRFAAQKAADEAAEKAKTARAIASETAKSASAVLTVKSAEQADKDAKAMAEAKAATAAAAKEQAAKQAEARHELEQVKRANSEAAQKRLDAGADTFGLTPEEQAAQDAAAKKYRATLPKPTPPTPAQKNKASSESKAGAGATKGDAETAEAVKKMQEVTTKVVEVQEAATQKNAENIAKGAEAIEKVAAKVPPPIDVSPIAAAQGDYHAANVAAHQATAENIRSLVSTMNSFTRELASVRQQQSNLLQRLS